ncbi:MAG: hypothetical protein K9W42_06560 [Candidatus Heimdallarchaeota archaeon]|nr:hypothetical protein [Candidatus Heimdallarchaeota archaeon]
MIKTTKNKSYTYVIDHDLGFAPNPFFDYLTVAACKPRIEGKRGIRGYIKKEDLDNGEAWVFANGGNNLILENFEYRNGKLEKLAANWNRKYRLVYAFRVKKILTFEEYYKTSCFSVKKRINAKTQIETFGDNFLHNGEEIDEKTIRYEEDPKVEIKKPSKINKLDIKTCNVHVDQVLISDKKQFYYFGCFAPNILEEFKEYFSMGRATRRIKEDEIVRKIVRKIEKICPSPGIYGFPAFSKAKRFQKERENIDYLNEIYKTLDQNTQKMISNWKKQATGEIMNKTLELLNCS